MKTFKVTLDLFHESFGGHDHRDGSKTLTIKARNNLTVRSKAMKQISREHNGWAHIVSVEEI